MGPSHPVDRPGESAGNRAFARMRVFLALPGVERRTFVLAWIMLGLAAIAIRVFPFKRLAPLLGKPAEAETLVQPLDEARTERARIVKRAVRRAVSLAPLRSDCLPQVFAGALLCRWKGIPATAYFGVRLGSDPAMMAHAWLRAGTIAVTGGHSFDEFATVLALSPSGGELDAGAAT